MTRYDHLFDEFATTESVFASKAALDPLREPPEIVPRTDQERELAGILDGITDGYLPTTVSVYGHQERARRTRRAGFVGVCGSDRRFGVEYVNLKECRSIFSAANEILVALGGEKKEAHEGLDGAFEAI